jgi:serine/threonine protein kinase
VFFTRTAWFIRVCNIPIARTYIPDCANDKADIKLGNILVDFGQSGQRFSTIQLADFGDCVSHDSHFAKEGVLIGTSVTRSPEALLNLPWGTATDIWSFGSVVRIHLLPWMCPLFSPTK